MAELRLLAAVVVLLRNLSGIFRRHFKPQPGLRAGQRLPEPADHVAKGCSG